MTSVKDLRFVTVEQVNNLRAKAIELEVQRNTLIRLIDDAVGFLWDYHDGVFLDEEDRETTLDKLCDYVHNLKQNNK